ncbi:MAG TPA: hypothetical protein DCE81_05495 [Cytophagales bacterium]|nr:hypothetical protein [Cytophagales bacterium]
MKKWIFLMGCLAVAFHSRAQQNIMSQDSLKMQILQMEQRLDNIEVNLGLSQKKFQTGMLVATIGYTVTIAGGLMLGREQDQLGQVLLVAGGATGITGTYMLVDSFKYLGRASGKKSKRR